MPWILVFEQLLNGVQLGVTLFLMAAGLTLVLGIMNLVNLAHGSLYMVGAYLTLADLAQRLEDDEDFIVTEDNVPQTISVFQFQRLDNTPAAAAAPAAAAEGRVSATLKDGVALLADLPDQRLKLCDSRRVGAEERVLIRERGLHSVERERTELLAARCREHDAPHLLVPPRQVSFLGFGELLRSLQAKHLGDGRDALLDRVQGLLAREVRGRTLHRGKRGAQQLIRPDHDREAVLAEHLGRCRVVFRRHDDDWQARAPFELEREDFVGRVFRGVDQYPVRACGVVGLCAAYGLVEPPARHERLHACDDGKVLVLASVLRGFDLAAELVDVREGLSQRVQKAVGLRKKLILDADRRDAAHLELLDQAARVVEVAVPCIAVEQDRQPCRVRHEFQHLENLRPARLVRVANTVLRGQAKAARPDALETGFLTDASAQAVVRLAKKLELARCKQLPKPYALGPRTDRDRCECASLSLVSYRRRRESRLRMRREPEPSVLSGHSGHHLVIVV